MKFGEILLIVWIASINVIMLWLIYYLRLPLLKLFGFKKEDKND